MIAPLGGKRFKEESLINNTAHNTHFEYDKRFSYQDLTTYFSALAKRGAISRYTYSVLYHPLLLLAKTYETTPSGISVKLTSEHIILLSYILGYIRSGESSSRFYGSNSTISKDLGRTVRTIQRQLKDLSNVGYIEVVIDNYSERSIYVNYEKIFAEFSRILFPKFDSIQNINLCLQVVQDFISRNFIEKTRLKDYTLFLRIKYLTELSKSDITNPLEFLYKTLAEELKLDFDFVRNSYEKARFNYIRQINDDIRKQTNEGAC